MRSMLVTMSLLAALLMSISQIISAAPRAAQVRATFTSAPTRDPRDALDALAQTAMARRMATDRALSQNVRSYLPLIERAAEPLPPVRADLVSDVVMPGGGTLYGAVQPSMVQDATGLWWIALYVLPPKGSSTPAGTRLAQWRMGETAFTFVTGPIGDGPRGTLGVGCDQQLYLFTYDDVNRKILAIYRITGFPGPAQPTQCRTTVTRVQAGQVVR